MDAVWSSRRKSRTLQTQTVPSFASLSRPPVLLNFDAGSHQGKEQDGC